MELEEARIVAKAGTQAKAWAQGFMSRVQGSTA